MERLRSLRNILVIITVLLAVEIAMLAFMLRPASVHVLITLGIIALLCVYLIRLAFGLIRELMNKDK